MRLIQSAETRKKRLATGVLLFVTISLIVFWSALPWIEYSKAYDKGMEYAKEGVRLAGHASYEIPFNCEEAERLSLYASENFSLAHSKFEEAAEIAKNNPIRVHLVEYIHRFLKDERARAGTEAEEMADRSLNCSELALVMHDKIKYTKEGKYTKEEWKYLHKEISQLASSIWANANVYTVIGKGEVQIVGLLFPFISLGKWIIVVTLIGFLIGYFMKRYEFVFSFIIGFVISIYYVALHEFRYMYIPKGNHLLFLLETFFLLFVWGGFGLGFTSYGASVLGRRVREGEKPFLSKNELIGVVIISIFAIWLVLIGVILIPYYPPRFYPQIYTIFGTYAYLIILPLTAFLYGMWSKERHGIMSFMVAYFPLFVLGCSWLEGSWLCFPIGVLLGLAGLAGWFVSKMRSAKSV
jgi:hypothetical protein